jgi:hypothetical protein
MLLQQLLPRLLPRLESLLPAGVAAACCCLLLASCLPPAKLPLLHSVIACSPAISATTPQAQHKARCKEGNMGCA